MNCYDVFSLSMLFAFSISEAGIITPSQSVRWHGCSRRVDSLLMDFVGMRPERWDRDSAATATSRLVNL